MADDKAVQNQKELNKAGTEFLGIQKEILDAIKKMVEFQELSGGSQRKITNAIKGSNRVAKILEGFSKEDLKNAKKREKFQEAYNNFKSKEAELEEEIAELREAGAEGVEALEKKLADAQSEARELAKAARQFAEQVETANKISESFAFIEDFVKDIPVIRTVFKEFTDASKEAVDAYTESLDKAEATFAGIARLAQGFAKIFGGAIIAGILKGLNRVNQTAIEVQRTFSASSGVATSLAKTISQTANVNLTMSQLTKAAVGFGNALGAAVPPSGETVKQITIMAERMGISAEQASELYKLSSLQGKSFKETTDNIISQTKVLNLTGDVTLRYRDILEDVSRASADTLMNAEKFPGGIAKAAYEARRFGLSLSAVQGSQSSMLNFQESISAELEAELLTGKQLNLQKAREAALMGDQATLANEIAKNVGSAAEFQKLNVIQQQAVARAMGMEVGEVSKALLQRKALLDIEKETGLAGLARLSTQEQIARLTEKFGGDRQKALKALGQEEMAQQEAALTAQEALANSMEMLANKLGEIASALLGFDDPLKKLVDLLQKVNDFFDPSKPEEYAKSLNTVAGGAGGVLGAGLGMKAGSFFGGNSKLAKKLNFGVFGKSGLKAGAKLGGKGLSKLIPGMGFAFAMADLFQGDTTGALLNAGAGIASFFPGVGTGIAAALTAADVGRELLNDGTVTAEDFTLKTHPKDTLVMAGGTKFGEETNNLLRELILEVKANNNVYIDSRKVNSVLAMNAINQ